MWLSAVAGAYTEPADIAAVKAADEAFYTALSGRDLAAMKAVWADKPYTINIGPRSRAINVGSDAVAKYWGGAFDLFSQISVTKAGAHIQTNGSLAWVTGIESATLQPKAGGNPLKFETFVTHVFERHGDRWLLVLHHAQMIPN